MRDSDLQRLYRYTEADLIRMQQAVYDAFGAHPRQSLAEAAFRVLRLNIADDVTQRCARVVCAAQNRGPREQWLAVEKCARMLDARAEQRGYAHDD